VIQKIMVAFMYSVPFIGSGLIPALIVVRHFAK
jgi:hypothetical protein